MIFQRIFSGLTACIQARVSTGMSCTVTLCLVHSNVYVDYILRNVQCHCDAVISHAAAASGNQSIVPLWNHADEGHVFNTVYMLETYITLSSDRDFDWTHHGECIVAPPTGGVTCTVNIQQSACFHGSTVKRWLENPSSAVTTIWPFSVDVQSIVKQSINQSTWKSLIIII